MKFFQEHDVQQIIDDAPRGKNTNFLKASHSIWMRFKNYDTHPPYAYYDEGEPVSIIFATRSKRTKYINLYEIVTLQGKERNGYGRKVWEEFVAYYHANGMERIKLSCTPESIGFHMKNGLVFWSVDKQGSLRSDQPLMPSVKEQVALREKAILDPSLVIPNEKVCEKLKKEDIETLKLSQNKLLTTHHAIQKVGEFWLRKHLYD